MKVLLLRLERHGWRQIWFPCYILNPAVFVPSLPCFDCLYPAVQTTNVDYTDEVGRGCFNVHLSAFSFAALCMLHCRAPLHACLAGLWLWC